MFDQRAGGLALAVIDIVLLNFSSGAGYTSKGQNVLNSELWLAD
jgi:hypothetical protein